MCLRSDLFQDLFKDVLVISNTWVNKFELYGQHHRIEYLGLYNNEILLLENDDGDEGIGIYSQMPLSALDNFEEAVATKQKEIDQLALERKEREFQHRKKLFGSNIEHLKQVAEYWGYDITPKDNQEEILDNLVRSTQ